MADNYNSADNTGTNNNSVNSNGVNGDSKSSGNDNTDNSKTEKFDGKSNLIPLDRRTKEEQRRIATAGGKASGEARRKKKHMREVVQEMLAHAMDPEQIEEILGTAQNLLDDDRTVAAVLTARMVQEAAGGSFKAYEVLRDTAGYKPKDQLEVEAPMTDADREMLERVAKRINA